MKLTDNFTLAELTKSQTAERCGIDNNPDKEHIENLQRLCDNILQPVRDYFQKPVTISSGYRSPELSQKIGSSSRSQHCKGEAADFEVPGVSNKELADFINENLDYDQVILEFHNPDEINSGWVHASYVGEGNRSEYLLAEKDENGKVRYSRCL
jgi:zinc D-Ala-D-Ala carboxypeptidase|tara:strand:+ start:1643 stop:2104 length:462 start_codon:yes stop_codon:yes gene_type:complete